MKIRKKETSIGIVGKILNTFSSSKQDTYSCDFINQLFPIGKVEIFFDNEDHSNHLGLTWERTSIGRVPVGIDSSDIDFNTIGKTGGSKGLQSHEHTGLFYTGSGSKKITLNVGTAEGYAITNQTNKAVTYDDIKTGTTGTGNSGNLQPYEVMAFWKRVK